MRICVRDGGGILATQWRDKAESPTRRVTPLFCAKVILVCDYNLYKFVKNKFFENVLPALSSLFGFSLEVFRSIWRAHVFVSIVFESIRLDFGI